jgi:hypothetical protein
VYIFPIIIGKPVTAKELRVKVITGQSSPLGRMDLGIYDSRTDGAIYPENRIAQATDIFVASDGQFVSGAVDVQLTPGLYWLALVVDNVSTLEIDGHDSPTCNSVGAVDNGGDIEMLIGFFDSGQATLLSTFPNGAANFVGAVGGKTPGIFLRCE